MPLTGLSEEEITCYENALMDAVPKDRSIGNKTLLSTLQRSNSDWTRELFFAIRNRLIERGGQLDKGKGKGGSVRRSHGAPTSQVGDTTAVAPEIVSQRERDLYEPMLKSIKEDWSQENGLDNVVAEITAQGGRRLDGKWTRPDITLASYRTYPYVPGKHFDLFTFEIKPYDSLDVTVVYEALAHRRAATRAYAVLHVPPERSAELNKVVDEICSEAKRVGIGILVAENPSDYETWEELVEPLRVEPDPERMNDFLAKQLSQGFREKLVGWFR